MTSKEQVLKIIESHTDTITNLTVECFELLYKAGYNQAIEDALSNMNSNDAIIANRVRELKK